MNRLPTDSTRFDKNFFVLNLIKNSQVSDLRLKMVWKYVDFRRKRAKLVVLNLAISPRVWEVIAWWKVAGQCSPRRGTVSLS